MGVQVVSLINNDPQTIEPGDYQFLHFPFTGESYDKFSMHQPDQPDGRKSSYPDDRSALIWPSKEGWGVLEANIHWEAASSGLLGKVFETGHRYTELQDVFVRDPLNLVTGESGDEGAGGNATGRDHRAPAPDTQAFTKQHGLFVHKGVPLALMVMHNAKYPVKVVHAQFKLTIWDVDAVPAGVAA